MTQAFNSKETLKYYQVNADTYFEKTVYLDVTDLYRPFLKFVPKTGTILDAGCGSGRDTRFFKNLGFNVVAFDNSSKMVKLASNFAGQDCLLLSFNDIKFKNKFDGVWACASILHIPKRNIPIILKKLSASLKTDGIFYLSFKYGNTEVLKNGRHFSNYDEKSFNLLLANIDDLTVLKYWVTNDLKQSDQNEKWLNVLLKKTRN
ncbi:MAG: class I SAM-dependent methyltransferase [Desulfobacterales bacterium]|nr:class I SAM-dependent methyltransferase [Desulfobacterales bacterium]